jgi:hypothetical protein
MPFFGDFFAIFLPLRISSTLSALAKTSIFAVSPSHPGHVQLLIDLVSCHPVIVGFSFSYTGKTAMRGPLSSSNATLV